MKDLRKFIATTLMEYLNEQHISNNNWYHGSDIKKPIFSFDHIPIFFTKNKEYAKGYGKYINCYKLDIKNPFDTRNFKDLEIYNFIFIPWAKEYSKGDERYVELGNGQGVPMITADLLYLFLRKTKREGIDYGYDGVIVDESGFEFDFIDAKFSIFPLSYTQIKQKNCKHETT